MNLECCKHNPRKWRAVKESATLLVPKNLTTGNRLKSDRHGDDNQELKKLINLPKGFPLVIDSYTYGGDERKTIYKNSTAAAPYCTTAENEDRSEN